MPDSTDDLDSHAIGPKGSSFNLFERNSVRPKHLSGHNIDHDYYFELPFKGAGRSISIAVIDFTPFAVTNYPAYEPTSSDG